MRLVVRTAAILLTSILAGCEARTSPTTQAVPGLPTADVVLAGRVFKLEIADNDAERSVGLMNRTTMPADHGMLFAFPKMAVQSFWMKNTRLPLDIAFLDDKGVVLNVEPMYPNDLTDVSSKGPAQYAIELNQGIAHQIGLKPGDRVKLPKSNPE